MRIALTHNLRLSDSEEEAEFDTEETVNALAVGHRAAGPPRRAHGGVRARLAHRRAARGLLARPHLQHRRGAPRPLPRGLLSRRSSTSSASPTPARDAYALAVTLDKQLTKLILREHGIRTPGWQFVEKPSELKPDDLHFPVIVKPNFEGSLQGHHPGLGGRERRQPRRAKVADGAGALPGGRAGRGVHRRARSHRALPRDGRQRTSTACSRPSSTWSTRAARQSRRYAIYDYELKTKLRQGGHGARPGADLRRDVPSGCGKTARTVFEKLDCKDLGRIDFRLSDAGVPYFLEINALPSLEPGAGIYAAAALEGLHFDGVIDAVIQSAARRYRIKDKPRGPAQADAQAGPLRVGFTFNVKRIKPDRRRRRRPRGRVRLARRPCRPSARPSPATGHEVVDLEATPELPMLLSTTQVDVVFNIAEGFRGRNRESQVPALLELLDIPYTGSDPATLSLALDKGAGQADGARRRASTRPTSS